MARKIVLQFRSHILGTCPWITTWWISTLTAGAFSEISQNVMGFTVDFGCVSEKFNNDIIVSFQALCGRPRTHMHLIGISRLSWIPFTCSYSSHWGPIVEENSGNAAAAAAVDAASDAASGSAMNNLWRNSNNYFPTYICIQKSASLTPDASSALKLDDI